MCCEYEITEKQYFILEKRIKEIDLSNEIEFRIGKLFANCVYPDQTASSKDGWSGSTLFA